MPQDDSDEAWIKQASCQQRHCSSSDACQSADGPGGAVECVAHHINNLPPAILHGIFGHLGPRELCAVSAVCSHWRQLNQDKAANGVWKKFYTSRWRVLGSSGEDVCWQTKYGSKMKQGKSWSGKYEYDGLYGHKAGVKALKLLPSHGVLLTGSLDRTIRLWDLTFGMPLSISRPHGGTVRAVALDHTLVASGSSDNVVRLWHARNSTNGATLLDPAEASAAAAAAGFDLGLAESLMELDGPADSDDQASAIDQSRAGSSGGGLTAAAVAAADACTRRRAGHGPYSVVTGEADEGLFDLSVPGQHLRGHIGPVTSLCLTDSCLYSGSWDYTVRVWRRGSWDCVSVLKYPDWVYSVVARGGQLLVALGPEVHVHDQATGKLVRKFQNLHEGSVSCLEGTHSGRLLFSGGADGLLMAHDLRMKEASRVLWHHNAGVNGLALEDPWLVSAASDGTVIMHNLEAALPNNFSGCVGPGSTSTAGSSKGAGSSSSNNSKRTLGCPGQSGPMYCVDMAESWLAAGGESPAVPTWDFTKAEEVAARAAAARAARGSSKRAAKLRKAAAAGTAAGAGSSIGAAAGAAAQPAGGKSQAGKKGSKSSRTAFGSSSAATSSSAVGTPASSMCPMPSVEAGSSSSSAGRRLRPGLLAAAAAAASNAANTLSSTPPGSSSFTGGSSRTDRFHKLQSRRGSKSQQQQQQEAVGSRLCDPAAGAAGGTEQPEVLATAGGGCVGGGSGSHAAKRTTRAQTNNSSSSSSSGGGGGCSADRGSNGGCGSSYGSSPQGRWHGPQHHSSGSGGSGHHAGISSSPVQHGVWLGGSSPPVGSSRLHYSSSSSGGGGRRHSNNGQGPVQQQGGGGGRPGIPIPAARHSQQQQRRLGAKADAAGSFEQGWHAFGLSPTGAAGADSGASPSYAAAVSAPHAAGPRAPAGAAAGADCSCAADQGSGCVETDSARAGAAAARYHVPFSSSYPSAAQGPGPWLVPGSSPRYEVWGTTLRIAAATNCDRRLAIKRPEGAGRNSADGNAAGAHVGDGEEAPVTIVSGSISN